MKVSPKKGVSGSQKQIKNNAKKVSPTKSLQSHTIVSMFKKQQKSTESQKCVNKGDNSQDTKSKKKRSGTRLEDENDTGSSDTGSDVEITKVEKKSPYFKQESGSNSSNSSEIPTRKKKLRLSLKKSASSIDKATDEQDLDNIERNVVSLPSTSSQKENSCEQNVSRSISSRLSLGKRRSSATKPPEKKRRSSETFSADHHNVVENKLELAELEATETIHQVSNDSGDKNKVITDLRTVDSDTGSEKNFDELEKAKGSGQVEKFKDGLTSPETRIEFGADRKMDVIKSPCKNVLDKNTICSFLVSRKSNIDKPDSITETRKEKTNLLSRKNKGSKIETVESNIPDIPMCSLDSEDSLPVPSGGASGEIDTEEKDRYRVPYYLENFRTVIKTVMADEDNVRLFNDEDLKYITNFSELSEAAQKLFVRIFSRKWTWLPLNKLKYQEIDADITTVADELVRSDYFHSDVELTDLERTLNLLQAGDLKSLAKTYHMNTSSQNKPDIIRELIKKSKQNTIGTMFKAVGLGGSNMMMTRAKKLLGNCYMMIEEPRNIFVRMLMLFSLPDTVIEDDANGGQNQLFQMLMVNMGKVVYPTYEVNKKTSVFADRNSLIRFSEASMMEHDMYSYLEKNDYNSAFNIYTDAVDRFETLCKEKDLKKFDGNLPIFLRPYTAGSVYVRILSQGVEILQRRKNYKDAVTQLHKLLKQECYCPNYRGRWWDRLALNYDAHLKEQLKALNVIKDGLRDQFVKTGHRLSLYQRAEKICSSSGSKFKSRLKEFNHEPVLELPQQTIEGTMMSDNVPGMKYKFMIKDTDGDINDVTFCGVEELVLQHYKQNGYPQGLHAEGSVVSNLFCLYFWDIIFKDVDDTFHSPFQTHPLDLYFDDFYMSRKTDIDDRIEFIRQASEEDLHSMMSDIWDKYYGTMCVGINWERFDDLQHAQGLVSSMGGAILAGILERYGKDPKNTRGGFPDLTLWNTETKTLKISEVKGPGDRLSHKQILWIDYLLKLGVDAEVCHVKGVGAKRLKPSVT